MKLLDPFSGFHIAAGHAMYHGAFFAASWFVLLDPNKEADDPSSADANLIDYLEIAQAFNTMRWSNFVCCFAELSFIFLQTHGGREYSNPEKNKAKGYTTMIYLEKTLVVCNTL